MTTGIPAFTAPRDQAFLTTAAVIRNVQETEHRWLKQGDPMSPTLPWTPFQPADFLSIVFECAPELKGRDFLDVGCGPGTKMLMARHFYGLEAHGIETDDAMGTEARSHGLVLRLDAADTLPGFYGAYDLIWLCRWFRDPVPERRMEAWVMDEMKPGAILAGSGWEICPADHRWIPVVDDWELRRGAWMKPLNSGVTGEPESILLP